MNSITAYSFELGLHHPIFAQVHLGLGISVGAHASTTDTDRRIVEIERLQQPTALPVRFDSFAVLAR
jgi:hypothetical protein